MSALGKLTNNHSVRMLKDGVRILSSISSPIQIAVAKATREHIKGPPKEKHVRFLLSASGDREACNEMLEALVLTIHENAWVRTLKALQVIHRLVQEGKETFVHVMVARDVERLLNLSAFRDKTSSKGTENGPFIRSYASYLITRILTAHKNPQLRQISRKLTTKNLCRDATVKNPGSLFDVVEDCQKLLTSLLACQFTDMMLRNSTTLSAFSLLLRDSFGIYKVIADCIILLMDFFFKLSVENAEIGYRLYATHVKHTQRVIELYDFTRSVPGIKASSIPKLKMQPDDILKDMREYIERGGEANGAAGEDHGFGGHSSQFDEKHDTSFPETVDFELGEIMDQDETPQLSSSNQGSTFSLDDLLSFDSPQNSVSSVNNEQPLAPVAQNHNSRDQFIQNLNQNWEALQPPPYPHSGFPNPMPPQYAPPQPFAFQGPPQFAPNSAPNPGVFGGFQPQMQGRNPFASDDAPPPYPSNPFEDPFDSTPSQPQQLQQPQPTFSALDDFLR